MFKVLVNSTEYNFPSKLGDITLGQRIAYQAEYGEDLDARLTVIEAMTEGPEKELEQLTFSVDMACKTFSFFTKIDEKAIKESTSLSEVLRVFSVMKDLIYVNGTTKSITTFEWNNEKWTLYLPEVKNNSEIQFGEFVDSKQVVEDLIALGGGYYDRLPRLCAIYLRKKGEVYDPAFAEEDSDRVRLMDNLPMDIALSVGFFLTSLINQFRILLVSSNQAQSEQVGT